MSRILDEVDAAIARMPWDDDEKSRTRVRARQYDHACGCAFGGALLVLSIVVSLARIILADPFSPSLIPLGAIVVFCAGLAGKMIGVGWARTRLRFLHWSLIRRIPPSREVSP